MQWVDQTEEILEIYGLFEVIEKEHKINLEESRETSAIKTKTRRKKLRKMIKKKTCK